jgi:hypothetical protein
MKTPIEAEQIRQAALRGVYVPSPTASKPVETPKPPADDEQVERVARAIWKAYGDESHEWTSWTREARAAVAAMGGGRRYAVYCKDDGARIVAFQGFPLGPTTDKTYLLEVLKATEMGDRYEVREYVEPPKVKTAEEIADECLAPIDIKEKHRRITAAIENARKGADCGNP